VYCTPVQCADMKQSGSLASVTINHPALWLVSVGRFSQFSSYRFPLPSLPCRTRFPLFLIVRPRSTISAGSSFRMHPSMSSLPPFPHLVRPRNPSPYSDASHESPHTCPRFTKPFTHVTDTSRTLSWPHPQPRLASTRP